MKTNSEPKTLIEMAKVLLLSKQGWSTDGQGFLNGEDGTAIFIPDLIGPAAPEPAAPTLKRFRVNYGATTTYNMDGEDIVHTVDAQTAGEMIEERDFEKLTWNLVSHHELVEQLDKSSLSILSVEEVCGACEAAGELCPVHRPYSHDCHTFDGVACHCGSTKPNG